jgi:hypothetical protein
MNFASGYTGDLINAQVFGVSELRVRATGQTQINTTQSSATLNIGVISATSGILIQTIAGADSGINIAGTAGNNRHGYVDGVTFEPTFGSGGRYAFSAENAINQTGSSTGLTAGFNAGSILTSYVNYTAFSMTSNSTRSANVNSLGPLLRGVRIVNTINHTGSVTGSNVTDFFVNTTETSLTGTTHNFADWQISGATKLKVDNAGLITTNSTTMIASNQAFTNGAGASAGTLTNAPSVGNPTKWIPINDNGTTRYIPCW